MTPRVADDRSIRQREQDEEIAAEPQRPPLKIPKSVKGSPVETFLGQGSVHRRAVAGVVENGLVRPVDPAERLPEHARVVITVTDEE